MRAWANLNNGAPTSTEHIAGHGARALPADITSDWPTILGESETQLWTTSVKEDPALVAGKVQNLRVACTYLNGTQVVGGTTFSFWKSIGRPSQRKGYVNGRELREGCMVASVGGGLCQISNALYCAALDGGLEIVERHAHSQIIPGSLSEIGRDATVYWNYVDLRFRHALDFIIVTSLSHDALKVQIRAKANVNRQATAQPRSGWTGRPIAIHSDGAPGDCVACEQTQCVEKIEPSPSTWQTAFLLDEVWPEYDQWIAHQARPGDAVLVPLNGALRQRKNYNWTCLNTPGLRYREHRWLTLYRSLVSRLLPAQGGIRQQKLLAMNAMFATAYARQLANNARHLVLPITLLADVWKLGALGGRSYDVLMTRAPLQMLHQDLDHAAALHPQSTTLADFRASVDLVNAEDAALRGAKSVVTPHSAVADYIAANYGVPVQRLAWECKTPMESPAQTAGTVLFPASALGRKGAYEVREACRQLGLSVRVLGNAQDEPGFWHALSVSPATRHNLFQDVACVVLPAFVEHRPGILLKAIERGIAVVCSQQCGLPPDMPNALTVNVGSVDELVDAIRTVVKPSPPCPLPV